MALTWIRDLSLSDFVAMENNMTMPDGEKGEKRIDVFAFVCEFAASRLKEMESALEIREKKTKADKAGNQGGINLRRLLLVRANRSTDTIPHKKPTTTEKKATRPKEELPLTHPAESPSTMRPHRRRRRTPNEYLEEIRSSSRKARSASGVASSSDLLALQVIENESKLKRKKKTAHDEKPKKKPRVAAAADTGPDPPPDLPESFKERIQVLGGRNPVLVIQKRLFDTDVGKQQNRLSIPQSALKTDFLEDHEKVLLAGRWADGHCKALKPIILDATGEERTISLRKWDMKKGNGLKSTTTYNLNKPWYDMVKANGWEAGDVVQLWAFRVGEELGLVIVKLEENLLWVAV